MSEDSRVTPTRLSPAVRTAVAAEAKLELLQLLETSEYSALELAEVLDRKRTTVMFHLATLISAGLVEEVRREAISGGERIFYMATGTGWRAAVDVLNALAPGAE
jgi:predicted transcriptional regulator